MFSESPLFGVGAGAFGATFGRYSSLGSNIVFGHGESDWMQFLAEVGLVGFLCVAIFVWLFFKDILYCHLLDRGRCVFEATNAGVRRRDRFALLVIMAGLTSTISIILHGIFDINLHIPSNALLTCVIGGILSSVVHNSMQT
jgi:O-antigen ligase